MVKTQNKRSIERKQCFPRLNKVENSWTKNPFEARHIKVSLAKAMRTVGENQMPQNGTHDHHQHQWYNAHETACQLWYWDFMPGIVEGEEVVRGVHLCYAATSKVINFDLRGSAKATELLNRDFTSKWHVNHFIIFHLTLPKHIWYSILLNHGRTELACDRPRGDTKGNT